MNTKQVAEWLRESADVYKARARFSKGKDSLEHALARAIIFEERAAQVESMTCDDEAVKEMAEALEGLLYRTEGISLQDKWDAGLMALQKYKARINESCIHWEEKQ